MRWLAIKCIHGYRYLLSPWVGNQCRFYPSCSHYAEEAIEKHGFMKGGYLTFRRLIKCHPWHAGVYVPWVALNSHGAVILAYLGGALGTRAWTAALLDALGRG